MRTNDERFADVMAPGAEYGKPSADAANQVESRPRHALGSADGDGDPLDDVVFHLTEEAFAEFVALLDAPPEPTDALRSLLSTKPPWSEE